MYSKEIPQLLLSQKKINKFYLLLYKYEMGKMKSKRKGYWVARKNLVNKIESLDRSKNRDWAMGVSSLVKTDKGLMHIPQIDFHCKISKNNLAHIVAELKKIGQSNGFIASSGRSYHFYGTRLLNQKDWIVFMGQVLRFNDYKSNKLRKVSDQRWVGASLIRSQGNLRISSGGTKKSIPRVVFKFK